MSGLDIFAWFVLIVLVLTVIVGFVALAMLPGKIAAQRNHPQAEAINIAGWMGALFGAVLWPLALIWAYTKPLNAPAPAPDDTTADAGEKEGTA